MAKYRKLSRTSSQRKALIRGQVTALIANGKIVTTEAKAKEIRKVAEGLIAAAVREKDNFDEVTVTAKVARKDADGKRVKEVVDGKKVTVYDEVEKKIKIDRIETDNSAESYLAIRDTAKSNIFSACRTSPLIMGMGQANTLSTSEFSDAYNIYNRTVILPVQKKIERCFNKLFRVDNAFKINKFTIDFE